MKKILAFALSLCCLLGLWTSCGKDNDVEQATSTSTADITVLSSQTTTSATALTTTTEPEPEPDHLLHIIVQGQSPYTVILPAGSLLKSAGKGVYINPDTGKITSLSATTATPMVNATEILLENLSEKTGVVMTVSNDAATAVGVFEILIGDTDREETARVKKKLQPNTFAVCTVNQKLVVVGYDDNMTVEALYFIMEHYAEVMAVSPDDTAVPDNFYYISKPFAATPANTLKAGERYTLKNAALVAEIAAMGMYSVMQGGTTDGKYLYYCLENQMLEAHESYILKVDPKTGKIVKRSASLQLDHSNDMTYNAKLNQLLVVHNAPNRRLVSFVDADTLEKVNTIKLDYEIFCMAYNERRDEYCIGISGGQTFAVVDAEFKLLRRYNIGAGTGYTTQGMTCDENYLYFAQSGANVVVVYDWEGNQIDIVPIEFTNLETENISVIGNDVYIGFYTGRAGGGCVYKTSFTKRS